MNITVTVPEAETILTELVRTELPGLNNLRVTSVKVEVPQIERDIATPEIDFEALILKVRSFRYREDEKIAAIKALRELCAKSGFRCGLYNATFFVESV